MIISRTPFRISFFGGGTDYPVWYRKHGGSVLCTTIDKYCYMTCRTLPPFFEHKFRVVYSKVELCQSFEEVLHPAVRETLRYLNINRGMEIHHDGDLPARSGMGSSSSFTVGLLHALYAWSGTMVSKMQLARESIHIEQNMIRETVGSQDQVAAAFGGLNRIVFHPDGEIEVKSIIISTARRDALCSHLMLFYTGIKRTASEVADSYVGHLLKQEKILLNKIGLVDEGTAILGGGGDICAFGELLHREWELKRGLGSQVSNTTIDGLYERARRKGAIGGKITGAGGGGFLLLFVPPADQKKVREELRELLHVPIRFESEGSRIVFYDPNEEDYSRTIQDRENRELESFIEMRAATHTKNRRAKIRR
jgi:D-glycero-alpha-D-manno-heptose-7-phosphate kinase